MTVNNDLLDKKYIKNIMMAGCIFMLLFIIVVETWSAAYTVYSADDFSIAVLMKPYTTSFWTYFCGAFRHTKNQYLDWQGTYFSMFAQAILNPLNGFGLPQLRIIMVLNALIFLFSIIFFTMVFSGILWKRSYHIKLLYCACIVFIIMNSRAYPEIFNWFCGAMVYSVASFSLFLSLSFFILSNITNKRQVFYAVLAALFSIGSQGSTLSITGTGCFIILVLFLLFWMQTKKFSLRNLVVMIVCYCASIITAVAPGNFVRHDVIEEGMHPILAMKQAIIICLQEVKLVTVNEKYCIVFLLLVLCGMFLYGKIDFDMKLYTLASGLLLATPVVTAFPVMLGYGSGAISIFPNRCFFVVNMVTVIVLANMAIVAGYWMAVFIKAKGIRPSWLTGSFGVLFVILLIRLFVHFSLADMFVFRTSKQLYDGTIQNYYEDCKEIFQYLSDCDEDDVMIKEFPASIENFGNFEIAASPDHWINRSVAEYYNINSIGYEKLVGHH